MKKKIISLFILGAISLPGLAQTPVVEEIIVTATKTERTLQEVPVAVSVVTADTIEKANVVDLLDLKAVVPSFCKLTSYNRGVKSWQPLYKY